MGVHLTSISTSVLVLLMITCCNSFETQLTNAALFKSGDLNQLKNRCMQQIRDAPDDPLHYHWLGVVALAQSDAHTAKVVVKRAIELERNNSNTWTTLAYIHHNLGEGQAAVHAAERATHLDPDNPRAWSVLGTVLESLEELAHAAAAYYQGYQRNRRDFNAVDHVLSALEKGGLERERRSFCEEVASTRIESPETLFRVALSEHTAGRLAVARELYGDIIPHELRKVAERAGVWEVKAMQNLGAIYQRQGNFQRALEMYERVMRVDRSSVPTLSNIGATYLSMNMIPQAVRYLGLAINLNAEMFEAHVNIGSAYAKLGKIPLARYHIERAIDLSAEGTSCGLLVRRATLLRPVMSSPATTRMNRAYVTEALRELEAEIPQRLRARCMKRPIEEYEHLHFYLVYHGQNEYRNQKSIANLLYTYGEDALDFTAEAVRRTDASIDSGLVRIGFISRFFQDDHPHALLVEGIIRALSASQDFFPLLLVLPHLGRHPGERLVRSVGGDHAVVRLSGSLYEIRQDIARLRLDVLVFVDTMSEPTSYFLTFARLAPTQVAFWGNPLTSGSRRIDYFVSSDWMEPLHAGIGSRMIEPHYSEQLVRISKHGIWYDKDHFQLPEDMTLRIHHWATRNRSPGSLDRIRRNFRRPLSSERVSFEVDVSGPLYVVAQSVFKLHPAFDLALKQILETVEDAHLVLLEGRNPEWTEHLKARLRMLMPKVFRSQRVHFVQRQASARGYFNVLAAADVVLHPFPFGGSKTAADAIALGLPLVTMKGAFLRGRMAAAMLRQVGCGLDGRPFLPARCLGGWTSTNTVAHSHAEYVAIAVQLGQSSLLRANVTATLVLQRHRLFQDSNVVEDWLRFFRRVALGKRKAKKVRRLGHSSLVRNLPHKRGTSLCARENLLKGLLMLNASNYELHNDLGVVYRWQGKLTDAIREFRRAVHLYPGYTQGLNNLGVALHAGRRFGEAEQAYKQAMSLAPRWEKPIYNLGNCYRDQNLHLKQERFYRGIFQMDDVPQNESVLRMYLSSFHLKNDVYIQPHRLERQVAAVKEMGFPKAANSFLKLLVRQVSNALVFPALARHHINHLPSLSVDAIGGETIEVITQFFQAGLAEGVIRTSEIQRVLAANIKNPWVSKVHLLNERRYSEDELGISSIASRLKNKVKQFVIGRRFRFIDAIRYAHQHLQGRLCAILNADIYVDARVQRSRFLVDHYSEHGRPAVLALLRWEADDPIPFRPRSDAQDGWVFRSPLQISRDEQGDYAFDLGRLRSDNRLAFLLAKRHIVVNPALDIPLYHVHRSVERSYSELDSIQEPGSYVALTPPYFPD